MLGYGKQPADAVSDDYTAVAVVVIIYGQSGVFFRLEAGSDGKLGEPVHTLCLFPTHVGAGGEAFSLAADFSIKIGGIKKSN